MIEQKILDVLFDIEDAVINNEYTGFALDYLVLHSLIREYKPKRFVEIGTNMGTGTKIIKNAIGDGEVFSLDLPTELAHTSLQHPISEGKGDLVGSYCDLPFTQLRGDSMTFDYRSIYPIDGWFIDGEHDLRHAYYETVQAIQSRATIIIYHDFDMPQVEQGALAAFDQLLPHYEVYRVLGTRIAYALKK